MGSPELDRLADIFRNVCSLAVEEDGVSFDPNTVSASRLREDEEYEGVRIGLRGFLGSARIDIQVDIGFGDAVTPGPVHVEMPTLLGQPTPRLASYPRETVIAEKVHAMTILGMSNSRMKDFFDVDFLASHFEFDGALVAEAIHATFARRQAALPTTPPIAFTDAFAQDAGKQTQWLAFLRKSGISSDPLLGTIVGRVSAFAWPAMEAARTRTTIGSWSKPRGWS